MDFMKPRNFEQKMQTQLLLRRCSGTGYTFGQVRTAAGKRKGLSARGTKVWAWARREKSTGARKKMDGSEVHVGVPSRLSGTWERGKACIEKCKGDWSWTFLAGLLALGAASVSFSRLLYGSWKSYRLEKARQKNMSNLASLSSVDERAISAVAPLLLAAETAAGVDETATMSSQDLSELEVNLRVLIMGMDSQLEALKDRLQSIMPEDVLAELDTISAMRCREFDSEENEYDNLEQLDWKEFSLYANHCGDEDKRTFRSLLFNKNTQQRLLRQVENQVLSRSETNSEQSIMSGTESGNGLGAIVEDGLQIALAGAMSPHKDKLASGGEDAFFVSTESKSFGIADGVGGWGASGIDSSEYSRAIISSCEVAARTCSTAQEILQQAFDRTKVAGSCTIAIAKYRDEKVEIVSLGDCETAHLRDGKVVMKTDIQEHAWNQPYQLSDPDFNVADLPEDALIFEIDVIPGDIIIMGSDGFWDNVWDSELEETITASNSMRHTYDGAAGWEMEASNLASRLVELAEEHSLNESYASPFADEKQRAQYPAFLQPILSPGVGGKEDDITVIVSLFYKPELDDISDSSLEP
jgi:protein phosphatase PTC7